MAMRISSKFVTRLLIFITFALCARQALSQYCPAYWYGYSLQGTCYRFRYINKLSWQDARDFCKVHGGDLVKIDSVQERNWVTKQIHDIQNRTHATSNWWVGLNNREFLTTWEWADGSSVNTHLITWSKGAPNNAGGNERCGEIENEHFFNDEECSDLNKYVCERNRGDPILCDADRGWQIVNGMCWKTFNGHGNFYTAKRLCDRNGASLVTIDSQADQIAIHDFAVTNHAQYWLGLYTFQASPSQQYVWMWSNGTTLDTSHAYWNGKPSVPRNNQNRTCAVVTNSARSLNTWNAVPCSAPKNFVCRKPEGMCFPGWIGHRALCFQFNVQYRLTFTKATQYCAAQGAELLRIDRGTTQVFLNTYLREMRASGANSFWIGVSDNNVDAGPYKWRNGRPVSYKYWVNNRSPTNTKHKTDCGFILTTDLSGHWRMTTQCLSAKAFVCMIAMDKPVKPLPTTPQPHYACPAGWRYHAQTCYKLNDVGQQWTVARQKCQGFGGDLVRIESNDIQGFINGLIRNGQRYWIGLNDRATKEGTFVWLDETLKTTYTHWGSNEPNNAHSENCVFNFQNTWHDADCARRERYICSKPASSIVPTTPITTPAMDWTVKCGPGWESNPNTNKCYMFVDQPLDWEDARAMCRQSRGDLVSIETIQEQFYIAGRIRSLNSIGLWTGANDRSSEGGWNWISGAPFSYLNWAAGAPSTGRAGGGTDCVIIFAANAQWDDVQCIARNGYICEKAGNVPTTKAPRSTTPKIPAGKAYGCPPYWKPFANSCYKIIQTPVRWTDAQTKCGQNGGKLASIGNRNEQNFIAGQLPKYNAHARIDGQTMQGFWIGLNDRQIQMTFQWSDGAPVTYTNWATNEPNNWNNKNEDCVLMMLNNRKWNDYPCTARQNGLVCKRPKSIVSATQNPYQLGCPKYTLGYGAFCYRIQVGDPRTWTDANTRCNRTYHGTLASINDRYTQSFISSMLWYKSGNYWIGLSDKTTPGTYQWVNGDGVQFTYWDRTHTGNEQGTCAGMQGTSPVGLWENLSCNQRQNYICQFPRKGYTPPPTPPPTAAPPPCPTGWRGNNGKCYYAFAQDNNKKTWMEARDFCRTLQGDLISLHSAADSTFFTGTLVASYKNKAFWIGLNDRDTENEGHNVCSVTAKDRYPITMSPRRLRVEGALVIRGYVWSDGSPTDYTHWNPGEPNNNRDQEDCVEIYTGTMKWNDNSCYLATYFVCQITRGVTIPPQTTLPTVTTSMQCGNDPNWFFYNQNCYMLNPTSGPNATLDWYDAESYCIANTAHLASIHTRDENQFLLSLVSKRSIAVYWLGFNELDLDGYKWTDHSAVDFDNWADNEPNDAYGGERCVEMYKWNAYWNDEQCSFKRGYVCKKPVNGHLVIYPTAYPPGGCANGFTRVPGGRNKCFYIGGRSLNTHLNWTAARDYCRRFGKHYDLVSIEDDFEQNFMTTMIRSLHGTKIWIGMSDRKINNMFAWSNNAPVHYTNWDRGEPTSSHTNQKTQAKLQNCVTARTYKGHEGKWADYPCSEKFAFVCSAPQDPQLQIISPPSSCKRGYLSYGGSCYKLGTTAMTWQNAEAACTRDGGHLASAADLYENAFINVIASTHLPVWIGLSDTQVQGLFSWSDGWPVKFSNWNTREPSYRAKEGCVSMQTNAKWNDSNCAQNYNYVCKIGSGSPPTAHSVVGTCKNGLPNGQFCYYVSINQGRSWPESNYICQKMGMQLASIHSDDELSVVQAFVSQAKVQNPKYMPNIWLGLAKGPTGSFQWSDQSAVNYLKWAPGAPSGTGSKNQVEECVEMNRQTWQWNDIACFTNRGFVCKGLQVGAPTNAPTLPPQYAANVGSNPAAGPTSSLSSGGIAGIVIGSLCVTLIVVFGVLLVKRSRPQLFSRFVNESSTEHGFDNALYKKDAQSVQIKDENDRSVRIENQNNEYSTMGEGSDA